MIDCCRETREKGKRCKQIEIPLDLLQRVITHLLLNRLVNEERCSLRDLLGDLLGCKKERGTGKSAIYDGAVKLNSLLAVTHLQRHG